MTHAEKAREKMHEAFYAYHGNHEAFDVAIDNLDALESDRARLERERDALKEALERIKRRVIVEQKNSPWQEGYDHSTKYATGIATEALAALEESK